MIIHTHLNQDAIFREDYSCRRLIQAITSIAMNLELVDESVCHPQPQH